MVLSDKSNLFGGRRQFLFHICRPRPAAYLWCNINRRAVRRDIPRHGFPQSHPPGRLLRTCRKKCTWLNQYHSGWCGGCRHPAVQIQCELPRQGKPPRTICRRCSALPLRDSGARRASREKRGLRGVFSSGKRTVILGRNICRKVSIRPRHNSTSSNDDRCRLPCCAY